MRKRFYLPLWIHRDSDNDVDGCMYFARMRHQSYTLFKDSGGLMLFSKYEEFTKPQAKQMFKHLYANHNRLIVTKRSLMIGEIVNRLDKIDRNLTNHIMGTLFYDWNIIPRPKLAHIILSYHINVSDNIIKFVWNHKIPCEEFDERMQKKLTNEMKNSKPVSAKEFLKETESDDEENKKDRLMKSKYFITRLNKGLKALKGQK